jgi:hypothetical protein
MAPEAKMLVLKWMELKPVCIAAQIFCHQCIAVDVEVAQCPKHKGDSVNMR